MILTWFVYIYSVFEDDQNKLFLTLLGARNREFNWFLFTDVLSDTYNIVPASFKPFDIFTKKKKVVWGTEVWSMEVSPHLLAMYSFSEKKTYCLKLTSICSIHGSVRLCIWTKIRDRLQEFLY